MEAYIKKFSVSYPLSLSMNMSLITVRVQLISPVRKSQVILIIILIRQKMLLTFERHLPFKLKML